MIVTRNSFCTFVVIHVYSRAKGAADEGRERGRLWSVGS